MRNAGRVVVLFLLGLLSTAVLSAVASLMMAVSLAATALIVPGTGTPNANNIDGYMQNFRDYYMKGTPCVESDCDAPYDPLTGEGLKGINYPASFWPIPLSGWCPALACDTFDVSVSKGVTSLEDALDLLKPLVEPGDTLVIAGYSQGARVVSIAKQKYLNGEWGDLPVPDSFVLIGNPNRPNGGLLSRLGFLGRIPILNVTTGQPTPTGSTPAYPDGIPTEDWAIRWEGIADWPTYLFNPLAVVNSILGFVYDHGTYLAFNESSDPGETPAGYTIEEWEAITTYPLLNPGIVNYQEYGDTKYYTITPKVLPLVRPLHSIPLIGKPIADLIEPALRVIIEETGYARSISFGAPIGTGTIPIFNPITLVLKLIPAILQGINNFFANFGLTKEIPLTPEIVTGPASAPSPTADEDGENGETSLVNDDDGTSSVRLMVQGNGEEQQIGGEEMLVANIETEEDLTLTEGSELEGTETVTEGSELEGTETVTDGSDLEGTETVTDGSDLEGTELDTNPTESPTDDNEGLDELDAADDPEPPADTEGTEGSDDSEQAAA